MPVTGRAILLAVLALAGCKPSHPGATLLCSPPECQTDTALLLVAEVEPSADSPFVKEEFGSITIDQKTGYFGLALDPQVTLTGVVRVSSGGQQQALASTVVATRPSRIAGRPDVSFQSTVNPTTGEYRLVLPINKPGEQYRLRATAINSALVPPKEIAVTVTTESDPFVDILFEDPLTLPEVHGAVLDSLQNPIAGMQVQAIDPDTLDVVSTTTITDVKGAYSIRLVANPPSTVRVVVTPTLAVARVLPTLTLDLATSSLGVAKSVTANMHVPPLPAAVHLIYAVLGISTSGAQTPVGGASCVFVADVSDPKATDGVKASYRATATTATDTGNAEVDLIPSDTGNRVYMVSITPDATSDFATMLTAIEVAPTTSPYGPSISLSLRPQLSGQVVDPSGSPLHGLQVVLGAATVAASVEQTPYLVAAMPSQTLSDADGRFALRTDKGFWDIGLIPPSDTMLPRLWMTSIAIESDLNLSYGNAPIKLPRGVMVHGIVKDPDGNPLARANVRLYTVLPDNANCPSGADRDSCLAPPRVRAEGSTGSDGTVGVILPSPPSP
jgi:hypothetical protein